MNPILCIPKREPLAEIAGVTLRLEVETRAETEDEAAVARAGVIRAIAMMTGDMMTAADLIAKTTDVTAEAGTRTKSVRMIGAGAASNPIF